MGSSSDSSRIAVPVSMAGTRLRWLAAGGLSVLGLGGVVWAMLGRKELESPPQLPAPVLVAQPPGQPNANQDQPVDTTAHTKPIEAVSLDRANPESDILQDIAFAPRVLESSPVGPPIDAGKPATTPAEDTPVEARKTNPLHRLPPSLAIKPIEQPSPTKADPKLTAPQKTPGTQISRKVNLNTADQATLELLPGIGPALAKRIVEFRQQKGPFKAVNDLDGVSGVGPKLIERIRPFVILEEPPAKTAPAKPPR